MPLRIYQITPGDQDNASIARLCDDEYLLWAQMDALAEWLGQSGAELPPAEYVANIAFCWRRNAATGGPVISAATMRRMADIGMSLYLSEYPGFADDPDSDCYAD